MSRVVANFFLRSLLCLFVFLGMTVFWVVVFDADDAGLSASFTRFAGELKTTLFRTETAAR